MNAQNWKWLGETVTPEQREECSRQTDIYELWQADETCAHDVAHAPGGGIKCTKCCGWFCY